MQCALSGQVPQEPVVSTKSGHVFEKRLIEAHVAQTGKCPVTDQDLAKDDLIDLQTHNSAIPPRAPSASGIPALLKTFQNEWDALMLETYSLKKNLNATREELARVMYQHDAACRVIARLTRERDEARNALANAKGNIAQAVQNNSASADAMDVDTDTGLPSSVVNTLDAFATKLAATRKKIVKTRAAETASVDQLKSYKESASYSLHSSSKPGILCADINRQTNQVVTGGADYHAIVFDKTTGKEKATLKGHKKKVTSVAFHPTQPNSLFTSSADGTARIWSASDGNTYQSTVLKDHSKDVVGCTVHPSGDYLVTASSDATWNFYDVNQASLLNTVQDEKTGGGFSCVQFHPDGTILGAGTSDNVVHIYDAKEQKNVLTFEGHSKTVQAISFSENGYYLATGDAAGAVKVWDLRKLAAAHTINLNSPIGALAFDPSGSYLSVASGKVVNTYKNKSWAELVSFEGHSKAVTSILFGDRVGYVASTSKDRTLKFFSQ